MIFHYIYDFPPFADAPSFHNECIPLESEPARRVSGITWTRLERRRGLFLVVLQFTKREMSAPHANKKPYTRLFDRRVACFRNLLELVDHGFERSVHSVDGPFATLGDR